MPPLGIVYGIQVQPRNKAGRPHGLLATAKAGRANKIAMTFEELKAIANAKAEKAKYSVAAYVGLGFNTHSMPCFVLQFQTEERETSAKPAS